MHGKLPPWFLICRYRNTLTDISCRLHTPGFVGNGSPALCRKVLVEELVPNSRGFSPIPESGAEELPVLTIELKVRRTWLAVLARSRKARRA